LVKYLKYQTQIHEYVTQFEVYVHHSITLTLALFVKN